VTVQLAKDSLDVGLVTVHPEESLAFYRDVLGLPYEGESPLPGGSMHRLRVGSSVLKLVTLRRPPKAEAAPGGLAGATGYRYMTLTVADLPSVLRGCEEGGRPVVVPPTELPGGATIAMVADPDGNWVELLAPV